jgi:hypothetical protein
MVSEREKVEKEEKQRENELEAAHALLIMKKKAERKKARVAWKENVTNTPIVLRRSSRFCA